MGGQSAFVPSTGTAAADTAAIQAAHDSFGGGGGTIALDAGPYALTGGSVNFTKPIHMLGVGPSGANAGVNPAAYTTVGSRILCASGAANGITVNADGCSFEKLAVVNTDGSAPSSGAGIQIATLGRSTRVVDCYIGGFFYNLEFVQGYEWMVDRCQFYDPVQAAIRQQNTDNADFGDGIISNSDIYAGPNNLAPDSAILWNSGGGLKVIGCKINNRQSNAAAFLQGVNIAISDGISTSVMLIVANSIENCTYPVIVQQAGPSNTGNLSKVVVANNEIAATGSGHHSINFVPSAAGHMSKFVAMGNVGDIDFLLRDVDDVTLIGNQTGGTAGVTDFGGTTNLMIQGGKYTTGARPSAAIMAPGAWYYDTTLAEPGYSDGSVWRNAAGVAT